MHVGRALCSRHWVTALVILAALVPPTAVSKRVPKHATSSDRTIERLELELKQLRAALRTAEQPQPRAPNSAVCPTAVDDRAHIGVRSEDRERQRSKYSYPRHVAVPDLLSAAELAQVVDFLAIVNERELWQDAALGSGHMGVSGSTMGGGGFRNAQLIGLDKQDGHPVPQLLYRRVFEAVVALNAEHWQFHLPAEPASVCIETMQVRQ
jgi:hypothetical protein